jgi:hypothetical protein
MPSQETAVKTMWVSVRLQFVQSVSQGAPIVGAGLGRFERVDFCLFERREISEAATYKCYSSNQSHSAEEGFGFVSAL